MAKYQKKTNNPKMGAPRKDIDFHLFEKLCVIHCTAEEIANIMKISVDTLETRIREHYNCTFSEAFKKYSAEGKKSLRRTAFLLAEKNPAMCIFLMKNLLGYRDNPDISTGTEIDGLVIIETEDGKKNG